MATSLKKIAIMILNLFKKNKIETFKRKQNK